MGKQAVNKMLNAAVKVETILPDSVAIYNDIAAMDKAIALYLQTIPLGEILVYMIDEVDARALPILAEQFDVLGYKGMRLALTEADKRALIKKAIELHRYKGSVWAVREAMKAIGFTDATISEGVSSHWANFSVTLLNEGYGINDTSILNLRRMIEEFKPQRSNLVVINMDILQTDTITFDTDTAKIELSITVQDQYVFTNKLLYDGTSNYDGSYDHSGDSDLVEIEVV